MAKGNLFLGTARRSVGDVVMYRRNGEQISRVRVRKISNPQSDGQALQRSYMAAVSKFYSFFKSPLEKSWQGLNRSQSQSAFLRANANLVRSEGYYVTKGFGLAPLALQVSKGTIQRVGASINADGDVEVFDGLESAIVGTTGSIGTISQAFIAKGYSAGDQVTILTVLFDDDLGYMPRWCRFVLDPASQESLADTYASVGVAASFEHERDTISTVAFTTISLDIAAAAIIVSRYSGGEWQRSTEYMAANEGYLRNFVGDEARAAAIASYQGTVAVPQSDVYLNGSTTESTEPVPAGVWPYDALPMFRGDSHRYVIPQAVQPIADGIEVLVTSTLRSSGGTAAPYIINNKTGDANVGKMLVWSGTTGATSWALAPIGKYDYLKLDAGTDLATWLTQQGVTINWSE